MKEKCSERIIKIIKVSFSCVDTLSSQNMVTTNPFNMHGNIQHYYFGSTPTLTFAIILRTLKVIRNEPRSEQINLVKLAWKISGSMGCWL